MKKKTVIESRYITAMRLWSRVSSHERRRELTLRYVSGSAVVVGAGMYGMLPVLIDCVLWAKAD
jgi:hypothetical protein